jgi:hypothetical protein
MTYDRGICVKTGRSARAMLCPMAKLLGFAKIQSQAKTHIFPLVAGAASHWILKDEQAEVIPLSQS